MAVISSKQNVCRWILKHQHKLKQAVRACSLQVKEAPQLDDLPNERYEAESSEVTFKYEDLSTKLADPGRLRMKPDVSELKFGHFFTDHMMKIHYHEKLGGWQKPKVIPFENLQLHPAARVLHYAMELFEGTKVYRGVDGKLRWFRPNLNMARMNRSAATLGLPTFNGDELTKCIRRLVQIDQEWVPHNEKASLYIRPTLIAIDGTLGVARSESSLLYVIMCPVGSYWSDGQDDSVRLYADPRFTRAWPGGCGSSKLGSNYAPTIRIQSDAQKRGLQQVLWLYGPEHYLTEVGTMNIFIIYKDTNGEKVMATPPLNDLILPGVTRDSCLALGQQWKEFRVEERMLTMRELIALQKQGRLLEMFGAGTACIISPVASIEFLGETIPIPTMQQDVPIYRKLRDYLSAIQYGHIEHPWAMPID
ncbi:branched-chain-amino-acid aminotransferase, cytosolic isoform X4 [Diabrotica virgifera virgifera]|uniref:Branched-chain-amino-acid aminotransferase n=1 Tax=Diabrotica virgifera virgifera TaxID=50390 RepID=A0ABM5IJW4_DIAVI|nr:branched-chain-amino-acid aminotransferase, cytosolic isoform X7 [Diabrotica virgifera virgifera]XP_028134515.2 branched-chain-amino-acid aminotransferase, cytosolic isoform X5 [Diabrotica virgifera virgifera]XP_028134518.2 branched-chain-amino-acid aminotransferase, cytosolic isoform X6 [Diabrotica virgifera virgifera]XP_050504428.1 branched-chain-amino-acid aminotransferase, cytosolic isoform X1 [Diabrotica virgifera virgifera]XP_050504434.1 branched-chain-amino-acid aminotransferase, cyto